MGDYGIKASSTGIDVKSATVDGLDFTSQYTMHKVFIQSTQVLVGTSSTNVAHSLGYTPSFIATVTGVNGIGAGTKLVCDYDNVNTGESARVYTDSSSIGFAVTNGGARTYTFYYIIFVDEGT